MKRVSAVVMVATEFPAEVIPTPAVRFRRRRWFAFAASWAEREPGGCPLPVRDG